MPSREQGWTKQMKKHAGVFTLTKRQAEALAPGKGIRRVPEEEKEPKRLPDLPLKKSGEPMDVWDARQWEEHLRELSEKHPKHFQALRSLVEGRGEEVKEGQLRDLRKWGYLARDRSPLSGVKAIMEAAYRETPDGPALVDPIDLRTPEDAATLQQAEEQMDEMRQRGIDRIARIMRRRFNKDQGDDKGRPR